MPPMEKRANLRLRARAIDLPRDVFPTPGGPTKQIIGPLEFFFNFRTARNSIMRSLASFKL